MKIGQFILLSTISCIFVIPAWSQPPADWPALETQRSEVVIPRRRSSPRWGLDKASRKELDTIRRVDDDERWQNAEFLKEDNTGIFKLFPDRGCMQKGLIRVDGECSGFVPDSSLYTFRTGKYGGGDVGYFQDRLISAGFFSQSIMVPLWDTPIGDVINTHPAVIGLLSYMPPVTPVTAEKEIKRFRKGVTSNGYTYAGSVDSSAGPTFAVRKIEFKRGGKPVEYRSPQGYVINLDRLLRFKERKDSVYVFRVVRKDEAGVLTIIWKQLSRKDAPAIKFQKGDKYPDFGSGDLLRN